LAEHSSQVHLRVPGLEAADERRPEAALGLGTACGLAEEVGVAAEVFGRRERNDVDAILDRRKAGGGKLGDPAGELRDEVAEDGRRATHG
jgi:hypothetical protein